MKLKYKTKWHIPPVFQMLFVFLITAGTAGYFSFLGVDPHHDGIMMKAASDIAHGQMLFRDTFNQYGAFSTILQAWALLLFGNHLIVIKLLTAFFYGLIGVMLWLVWSLFLPEVLVMVSCLIWIFLGPFHDPGFAFLPWSSVYALFFQLVTLYTLVLFLKTGKYRWQIIAGIACALTFWCRQPVGFLLAASIIFYFMVLYIKKYKVPYVKPFFIFYILTNDIFFLWLLINKAMPDWFYQTIRFPSLWATAASHNPIVLFMNFVANMFPNSYSPLSIWTLMPLVTLYLGYVFISKKKQNNMQVFLFLATCINLASWLQYHPINDPHHLYWAASPMIGFVLYAASQMDIDRKKGFTFLVICILLFMPDIFFHVRMVRRKIRKYWSYPTLTSPEILEGMKVSPEEKNFFDDAKNKIDMYEKTDPSAFVTTQAENALYSLFDGKNKNCYNMTVNWDWKSYDPVLERKYRKAMDLCIAKYKPALFTNPTQHAPDGYVRATKGDLGGNYLLLPTAPFDKDNPN